LLAGSLSPGSLDPSFNRIGLVTTEFGGDDSGGAGALQPDGKIVVAGTVEDSSGTDTIGLARYLPDGHLDTRFGPDRTGEVVLDPGLMIVKAEAVAVIDHVGQPDDGKIVVAGTWTDPAKSQSGVALARFNPDGSLDTSFGSSGEVLDARATLGATALTIQPDGKIVVGGTTRVDLTTARGFVERFNTDGTPDSGFADPGVATAPAGWTFQTISGLAIDPNKGLFIAGAEPHLIAVGHLTDGGTLDASFGSGGIATTGVGSTADVMGVDGLAIDPSRGLMVAATTAPLTSSTGYRAVVTRFDFQGNVDPSFNNGVVEFVDFQPAAQTDSISRAVGVQPDGKVLLAGTTEKFGPAGRSLFALIRLNPDGTRDTGFGTFGEVLTIFDAPGTFTPIDSVSHSVLLQPDGNIVVTGCAGNSYALARYIGGNGSTTSPQPPLVGPITTPAEPVLIGTTVMVSASFTYNIPTDQHTAVWNWGDGTTSAGNVTEANGQGSVTGSHVYAAAGMYEVTLTVTDQRGASGSATAIPGFVVYNPLAGSITGSGLLNGPLFAIALAAAPAGRLKFRIDANYVGKRTVPRGEAVFQFPATHRIFHSTGLDWLVVSGGTAWYQGSGTINGSGSYGFLVSAKSGGSGTGKIRIRIWHEGTGVVVYDTQPGAPINATPTTPISGGRIALQVKRRHKR